MEGADETYRWQVVAPLDHSRFSVDSACRMLDTANAAVRRPEVHCARCSGDIAAVRRTWLSRLPIRWRSFRSVLVGDFPGAARDAPATAPTSRPQRFSRNPAGKGPPLRPTAGISSITSFRRAILYLRRVRHSAFRDHWARTAAGDRTVHFAARRADRSAHVSQKIDEVVDLPLGQVELADLEVDERRRCARGSRRRGCRTRPPAGSSPGPRCGSRAP